MFMVIRIDTKMCMQSISIMWYRQNTIKIKTNLFHHVSPYHRIISELYLNYMNTYVQMLVISSIVLMWTRFVSTATEVATTATTTTAITSAYDTTNYETSLSG